MWKCTVVACDRPVLVRCSSMCYGRAAMVGSSLKDIVKCSVCTKSYLDIFAKEHP